jgi:hypothetical protein
MSSEIGHILKFDFSPSSFVLGAKSILSKSEKDKIDTDIKHLKKIAKLCLNNDEPIPDQDLTNKVYNKFTVVYKTPQKADFSSRELRMLIYAMYRIKTEQLMRAMVYLLDNNWRDRFFNGLLFYVLSNWDSVKKELMELVLGLMQKKLKEYNGKRDKYLLLKKNMRFLTLAGPDMLGISLRLQDKGQTKACSLRTVSSVYFGLSNDRLDFEYYSRMIASYFEKDSLSKLDIMKEILEKHNYDATPKRLIPSIIINNTKVTEEEKENIRTLAISIIGDPSQVSRWSLSVGTTEEKENLEEARKILNEWIKRKFISLFFEKCVHEPGRKKFWLEHADLISNFNVYCTEKTKALLLQDSRLSDLVNRKVNVLRDNKEKDMSALGMKIGPYYMIEFSDTGSIHIYSDFNTNNITYFYELKKPHMQTIQSFFLDTIEGKLPHVSGWENTFEKWLEIHNVI